MQYSTQIFYHPTSKHRWGQIIVEGDSITIYEFWISADQVKPTAKIIEATQNDLNVLQEVRNEKKVNGYIKLKLSDPLSTDLLTLLQSNVSMHDIVTTVLKFIPDNVNQSGKSISQIDFSSINTELTLCFF